ncbi:hypothetical protein KAJ27_22815 [bacterium]|nr:hypothetical protein [bacterium]
MDKKLLVGFIFGMIFCSVFYFMGNGDKLIASEGQGNNISGFALPDLPNNFIVIDGETKNVFHYQIQFSQNRSQLMLKKMANLNQDYRNYIRQTK